MQKKKATQGIQQVSFTGCVMVDTPNRNGVCYTREAVENALSKMIDGAPIRFISNTEDTIIGLTTSKPYAVQYNKESGDVQFTVDGTVFLGGVSCIVNAMNDNGEITDITITDIVLCQ